MKDEYYTLVFKGDIGQFPKNPFLIDTPFGRPVACGRGHALDDREAALDEIEMIEATRGCCSRCKDQNECLAGCRIQSEALRWLANNPGAHPVNVQVIAKDALGEG